MRDSRQTRLLTEQLVSLAKPFPSLRASCLGSKVKDDKHRLQLGRTSTSKHSGDIPSGFDRSRKEAPNSFLCTDERYECHRTHLYLLHRVQIGIICFDLQSEKNYAQFADFNKDGYHLHLIGLGVIRVMYSVVAIQNQTELRD